MRRTNALFGIASVCAASSAATVAVRRASGCSTASRPKTSPRPCTANVATSPSGVVMRAAKRPLVTRCTLSPGSPSWKTISPRLNLRRRPARRSSSCGHLREDIHGHATTLHTSVMRITLGSLRARTVAGVVRCLASVSRTQRHRLPRGSTRCPPSPPRSHALRTPGRQDDRPGARLAPPAQRRASARVDARAHDRDAARAAHLAARPEGQSRRRRRAAGRDRRAAARSRRRRLRERLEPRACRSPRIPRRPCTGSTPIAPASPPGRCSPSLRGHAGAADYAARGEARAVERCGAHDRQRISMRRSATSPSASGRRSIRPHRPESRLDRAELAARFDEPLPRSGAVARRRSSASSSDARRAASPAAPAAATSATSRAGRCPRRRSWRPGRPPSTRTPACGRSGRPRSSSSR